MKNYKHHHSSPNPIMAQEEAEILLSVERALASSTNSQTVGRNGELPMISFLQRYLPSTLRAVSGHFITPNGELSPQLDILVVDARYPLLSENSDGSALVMLHSVIHIFELKTNLTSRDIKKSIDNAKKITALTKQVKKHSPGEWGALQITLLGYRTKQRNSSIESTYFQHSRPEIAPMDCIILRCHPADSAANEWLGGTLHLEPPLDTDDCKFQRAHGYLPMFIRSHTPLSDLYYTLVQNAYYTLGERDYSFIDIGAHLNEYMNWAST